MSILLLGGKGYIGSALHSYLATRNHRVRCVDLELFGNHTPYINHKMDYNDLSAWDIDNHDTIILLAGHSSVQMCETDYFSSFNNNCRNFLNLVHRIKPGIKFIYASSSSVYGTMDKNSVANETYNVYTGSNNYDISKYMIDAYMLNGKDGNRPLHDNWFGLRFGTVNGPSPNTRVDLMINSMVHTAKQDGYINMSNEHIDRAILGLNDLCRSIEAIVVNGTPEMSGIYNLCSFNASVGDIARNVSTITGAQIINHGLVGVPYDFRISNRKFENAFNFKFKDTFGSITESLLTEYPQIVKTKRDKEYHYA